MFKIEEINRVNQFYKMEHLWNELLKRSRDDNPFLTWEYLSTYWKYFGGNKELKILCVENEKKEIIAIAPLRLSRYIFVNMLTYNVIEPLGYMGADYTGLIISELEVEVLKFILEYLKEQNDWDFIYLYDVPETSAVPNALTRLSKSNQMSFEFKQGAICPYAVIPKSIEAIPTMLKHKLWKNLRRNLRNLEKDYKKVELVNFRQLKSVDEAMNTFFNLHQKRWLLKNKQGVFRTDTVKNFFLNVARMFAEKNYLALYFLMADDRPIATQLCYEYAQKLYYILGGFDPDFYQYSPGSIIIFKMLEKYAGSSIKEYDFLKGGEPYKFEWTNKYRKNLNFRFVNKKKAQSILLDFGIKTVRKTRFDVALGKLLQF